MMVLNERMNEGGSGRKATQRTNGNKVNEFKKLRASEKVVDALKGDELKSKPFHVSFLVPFFWFRSIELIPIPAQCTHTVSHSLGGNRVERRREGGIKGKGEW
jgi:hypothetical protein